MKDCSRRWWGLAGGGLTPLSDLVSHWEPWHLYKPPSLKMRI